MGISINSVRKHVQAANERMGARSRTGSVAAAVRAGLIGTLCLGALVGAGCGSGPADTTAADAQPSTTTTSTAPDKPLPKGEEGKITQAIRTFYAAAQSGDAETACAQMSEEGVDGFVKGAESSYPGVINQSSSTCEDAMSLFSDGIQANREGLQKDGITLEDSDLGQVSVSEIEIDGDTATAVAPDQVIGVDPKYISLERDGDTWLISGSESLSKGK